MQSHHTRIQLVSSTLSNLLEMSRNRTGSAPPPRRRVVTEDVPAVNPHLIQEEDPCVQKTLADTVRNISTALITDLVAMAITAVITEVLARVIDFTRYMILFFLLWVGTLNLFFFFSARVEVTIRSFSHSGHHRTVSSETVTRWRSAKKAWFVAAIHLGIVLGASFHSKFPPALGLLSGLIVACALLNP